MKPIKLEIEGVNSFLERQTIDFKDVLKEGLFGIFGNTGSGKSTILDAITLALYSKTQKNNKKEEYVNCKAKKAFVSFTFEILCEGRRRTFEFTREIYPGKRAGNASAYEYAGDKKFLLEDKSDHVTRLAEKVIGLNFEDFNKCIALPQGEFARFAKSTDSERLDIVARLFSLEKYGAQLYAKASEKAAAFAGEKDRIAAELAGYAEYGEENAAALREKIAEGESALAREESAAQESGKALKEAEEIFAAQSELVRAEGELQTLFERREHLEKAAKTLEIAADLDRLSEAEEARAAAEESLKRAEDRLAELGEELQKAKKKEEIFKADGFADKARRKGEELAARKALLANAEEDAKAAERLEADVEKLREEYRAANAELKRFSAEKENAKERLAANAALLESLGEERDIYAEIEENAKKESVKEEYGYLSAEYERRRCGETWLKEIIENKLAQAGAGAGEHIDLEKLVAEEKKKSAERKRAAEAKLRLTEEYGKAESAAAAKENAAAAIEEKGRTLAEELGKKREAIARVTGGEDYKTLLARTEKELETLGAERQKREKEEGENAEKIRSLSAQTGAYGKEIENLKNKICENTEKSNEILRKCGIMDKNAALSARLSEEERARLKAEIESFKEKKAVAEAKAKEKRAFLDGRSVEEGELTRLRAESERLAAEIENLKAVLQADKTRLSICEEKSAVKKRLEEELAGAVKRYDVARLLQNLVKGRQFLKYVANEYLEEITYAASSTLLRLSSGAYGLRYKEEFFVTDNKNGGAERSVNTLSGGETFLVSLSLAFALSAAICAKSDRPIEFFFLDEGFGTLDADLVETVLDSLEKLKSERFSIGIISHIKELKERINCKILVAGATETEGSRVEISY